MEWEVIKMEKYVNRGEAFVTISKEGQFNFSAGACDLLQDKQSYQYAQFLKGMDNGKVVLAIRFLREDAENALKIRRTKNHGKITNSMKVFSSGMLKEYFEEKMQDEKKLRVPVEKVDDNILKLVTE